MKVFSITSDTMNIGIFVKVLSSSVYLESPKLSLTFPCVILVVMSIELMQTGSGSHEHPLVITTWKPCGYITKTKFNILKVLSYYSNCRLCLDSHIN